MIWRQSLTNITLFVQAIAKLLKKSSDQTKAIQRPPPRGWTLNSVCNHDYQIIVALHCCLLFQSWMLFEYYNSMSLTANFHIYWYGNCAAKAHS